MRLSKFRTWGACWLGWTGWTALTGFDWLVWARSLVLPRKTLEKGAFTSQRRLQRTAHSFKLTVSVTEPLVGTGPSSVVLVVDTAQG